MQDEAEAVLAENRRLRRETRLLRQELDSVRGSRWWRLNPRRRPRRRRQDAARAGHGTRDDPASGASTRSENSAVAARFHAEVMPDLSFTRDDFTDRIGELDPIVSRLTETRARVLEIGSYEGMSACYFLWRLPEAQLTCVDTFEGGLAAREAPAALEATFENNVAHLDSTRVEKHAGDSRTVLVDLQSNGKVYDLIYVDGSHLGLDVLVDAALSWRLLNSEGVMVFDDYAWNDAGEDALLRPGPSIDAILELLAGKYDLLQKGAQVAIRKHLDQTP